jgi:hypothetical protein
MGDAVGSLDEAQICDGPVGGRAVGCREGRVRGESVRLGLGRRWAGRLDGGLGVL